MSPDTPLPDSSTINRWRRAFLTLNQQRLDAARKQLSVRQLAVLNVLPLLLHANNSRMPGYIAPDTPCGISGFTPGMDDHSALHQLVKGVQLPRDPGQRTIKGLFLMGSLGSIAQSRQSDLDVWVCYDELLSDYQIEALQEKCRRIEHWAEGQNTEVHFFLMNLKEFREGQSRSADGEDCGSTQHLLLLDEFYRSALWLAGATPRWWIIPEEQEIRAESYWQALLDNHSVDVAEWLDVGALPTIPPGEFVGAGLWQLNKGLDNPYKSLLKLLLSCEYTSHYPAIRPLAWDLKKRVHQGDATPENTDAYLLMLERIESHLGDADLQSRELARRAFYFKTGIRLTDLTPSQREQWRVKALEEQVQRWGWSQSQLITLDAREQWSPVDVMHERNALVTEMLSSYRRLAAFSESHAQELHISQRDLTVLGNRLYAAFDSRPGKIIDINPRIRSEMEEEKITFNLREGIWQLIPGNWRPGETANVLAQSASFPELLLFARRNGLLTQHSQIALYPTHNPFSSYELRSILGDIREIPLPDKKSLDFLHPSRPIAWHLFINAGVNPQQELSRRGMQKISNRDDALGFSSSRENLVQTIDLVTLTSWGEWQVTHYSGNEAIHEALLQILNFRRHTAEHPWPLWQVHCHCQVRSVAIKSRVEQLLRDLLLHLSQKAPPPYLLQAGDSYHLLEYRRGEVISHSSPDHTALLRLLSRARRRFRRWTLDRHALHNSPLRLVLEQSEGDCWQLWYWRSKKYLYLYVTDEHGSLYCQQLADSDVRASLVPLLRLMRVLNQRFAREQGHPAWQLQVREIRLNPEDLTFSAEPRRMPEEATRASVMTLEAQIKTGHDLKVICQGQTFSQQVLGAALIDEVRSAVSAARRQDAGQPVYLSDIHLHDNHHLIQHLQYRQKLERLLNRISEGHVMRPGEAQTSL
ncbi:class I adenylate cyclase [Thalassolituus sp.]|uniref:class I adenylate cyclase n=1 Tax=Thalassolituus sp. TaxID=2030822 RepID=UPI003513707D